MHHRQVAVQRDAAQQNITGVEVSIEEVDGHQTGVAPVDPDPTPEEVQPQRQAHSEGQVAQGQVEQIHTQLIVACDVLPGHVE